MEKLKLLSNLEHNDISLHPDVLNILFEHRYHVRNAFLQLKGLYEIDYMGLTVINSQKELITFSSMPHIEYNVIQQNFWQNDCSFRATTENTVSWWSDESDNLFCDEIHQIKLTDNHFTAGFTISRYIENCHYLYSYATRSDKCNLKDYYFFHLLDLVSLGNYFCKAILTTFSEYDVHYMLPDLHYFCTKRSIQPSLKLMIDHTIVC